MREIAQSFRSSHAGRMLKLERLESVGELILIDERKFFHGSARSI
tara:strand:- start:731 stop:865 length:135 start_codon:yes stop_codon:yes gene_type:complete